MQNDNIYSNPNRKNGTKIFGFSLILTTQETQNDILFWFTTTRQDASEASKNFWMSINFEQNWGAKWQLILLYTSCQKMGNRERSEPKSLSFYEFWAKDGVKQNLVLIKSERGKLANRGRSERKHLDLY